MLQAAECWRMKGGEGGTFSEEEEEEAREGRGGEGRDVNWDIKDL